MNLNRRNFIKTAATATVGGALVPLVGLQATVPTPEPPKQPGVSKHWTPRENVLLGHFVYGGVRHVLYADDKGNPAIFDTNTVDWDEAALCKYLGLSQHHRAVMHTTNDLIGHELHGDFDPTIYWNEPPVLILRDEKRFVSDLHSVCFHHRHRHSPYIYDKENQWVQQDSMIVAGFDPITHCWRSVVIQQSRIYSFYGDMPSYQWSHQRPGAQFHRNGFGGSVRSYRTDNV